jgi:hypothetical protein
MDAPRFITHKTIQEGIFKGVSSVNNNILHPLKIDRNSKTTLELIHLICDDLKAMHFTIKETDELQYEGKSIPGIIKLNTYDRKDGGEIKLNKKYPKAMLLQTIIHEYAHIKDESLPILPMDERAANCKALYDESYLRHIEFQVDMIALTLMMPPEKMWSDLIEVAYDIKKILDKYKDFDRYSVLRWISLIDSRFPCHFACVLFDKNYKGKIINQNVTESYDYNHTSDPQPFDITAVLDNEASAAATAFLLKKPEVVGKASKIEGVEYYCYASYESNLLREEMGEKDTGIKTISFDRLLVIGWKKADYEFIQKIIKGNW